MAEAMMRAWRTHEYGRPTDVLRLDTVPVPAPDLGEVCIKVDAIPFNLNDLPDAAALYFPFHLAWLGLFDRAELRAGESVLVHAAAGGSGSAAVQLAAHRGARVFATAGTDTKVELCRALGADVAINYNATDFSEVVLTETGNAGVDVVFDNVGESVFEASLKCTKYNGRYVMMGFASNKAVADEPFLVPRRVMLSNIKLCGVLLAYAQPEVLEFLKTGMGWNFVPAELGERIMREVVELVRAKEVRAVVGRVIEFEEIPTAIEAMANRETIGRTVALLNT
jgi:NADPH:quinone reductase